MESLDDSENNAKVSDSAYSNSCSNSQSRGSSKSTHSGSDSSDSSGYRGKHSSGSSSNAPSQSSEKRKEKESKKKKSPQAEVIILEPPQEMKSRPVDPPQGEDQVKITEQFIDVIHTPAAILSANDHITDILEMSAPGSLTTNEEISSPITSSIDNGTINTTLSYNTCAVGFCCVISMDDGVVIYTTPSVTDAIGFPKDMWNGRSFIDFIHPRDRNTFASQITSRIAIPKTNGMQIKGQTSNSPGSTMLCRIKKYHGLTSSEYGVKVRMVAYVPFMLKLSFKDVKHTERKSIYLIVQATPFCSAFKTPNEVLTKSTTFVMRHVANGALEYVDQESVPYLGYLPQDLTQKSVLLLYHPDDLGYLKQVYETIVKEGKASRTNSYRMMAQNGDYVTLQTEWSSFINPWSNKLEFIIGRHHVIEGPAKPDVFQQPDLQNYFKQTDEEKLKTQSLRESIVRVMNEVLTKPAEMAKEKKSRRCQDLSTFMDSFIDDTDVQPKTDDELRLDVQDYDSYFERDSVMLGGISPHYEDHDGKSSVETHVSYNQLNYNETLQRYFGSHQSQSCEDYNLMPVDNSLILEQPKASTSKCPSPVAHNSVNSGEASSSCESGGPLPSSSSPCELLGDYRPIRLTELLINKHNVVMQKDLVKKHRKTRSSTKGDRERTSNESRLKKREHFARCNLSFQPTAHQSSSAQSHGLKRSSKQQDYDPATTKLHCSTARQSRRKQAPTPAPTTVHNTINLGPSDWTTASGMNSYLGGMQPAFSPIRPHAPIVISTTPVPSVVPVYYLPTATSIGANPMSHQNKQQFQAPVQYMLVPQPVFGSAFMYSPVSPQVTFPAVNQLMATSQASSSPHFTTADTPLTLTASIYEQACKPSPSVRTGRPGRSHTTVWRDRKPSSLKAEYIGVASSGACSSTRALNRSTEAVPETSISQGDKIKERLGLEDCVDRTDGASSYSSFYSSFFITESGSAEESSDRNKLNLDSNSQLTDDVDMPYQRTNSTSQDYYDRNEHKSLAKRKIEPPWMDQVRLSPELMYKYQIMSKNVDEVLQADLKKMKVLEQPGLVNEQLIQLYLDLQLEGGAARLTLEEGITSSGSSGEETSVQGPKVPKRKKEYSKLGMIYEEDASLPPPNEQDEDMKPTGV